MSDFEVRIPTGDHGQYLGAADNFWRGDGARLQLGYHYFEATRTRKEAEFANIMINLLVSYEKFSN
jgi:hypothetical protein